MKNACFCGVFSDCSPLSSSVISSQFVGVIRGFRFVSWNESWNGSARGLRCGVEHSVVMPMEVIVMTSTSRPTMRCGHVLPASMSAFAASFLLANTFSTLWTVPRDTPADFASCRRVSRSDFCSGSFAGTEFGLRTCWQFCQEVRSCSAILFGSRLQQRLQQQRQFNARERCQVPPAELVLDDPDLCVIARREFHLDDLRFLLRIVANRPPLPPISTSAKTIAPFAPGSTHGPRSDSQHVLKTAMAERQHQTKSPRRVMSSRRRGKTTAWS